MTAMMAFFLLMWLLGATAESKRKSVADYFKPTPKSLVQSDQLAGSNGILGEASFLKTSRPALPLLVIPDVAHEL